MSRSKSKSKQDPHADREAQKYENPIASREFIIEQLSQAGIPLRREDIQQRLAIPEDQIEALRRRLRAMERDGQVVRNRRGEYGLPQKMNLIKGRVIAHRDGYGFLTPDEGGEDLFLAEKQMRGLLHGDRALVRVMGVDQRGRREAALVEVLERNNEELVGRFFKSSRVAHVEPSNRRIHQDILIPDNETGGAENGQIVLVQLIEQPTKHQPPVGRVLKVLGDHMGAGMEIDVSIRNHGLPHEWPEAVLEECAPLHKQKKIPANMLEGREDLRETPLVTIDGEDARDFDDAVYCEPHGKGWRLLVAIADVSSYVETGTALDMAARERGNSVYFPGQVIPMLPEVLSNEWCSLNPKVDRLCMVAELFIAHTGGVRRSRFFQGVMRSAARLTYTEVAAALQGEKTKISASVLPHLHNLHSLYQLLRGRRDKRGAIDFESVETKIIFGTGRKIESVVPVVRNVAHMLIEEMMLAANVAAAEWLSTEEMPLLYRVHEGPDEEKLTKLRDFLNELGLRLDGKDKPQAKHYAKLIKSIEGRPDRQLIQTVLLRSMRMATYTPENAGHFGLAYEAYAHFTSPIRRYPDLLVHRAIRHRLRGLPPQQFAYTPAEMAALGEHCSMTERRADEATREAMDWLKCEYMLNKVGETYEGIVTGVTSFGLFVQLDGVYVEGLIHVTSLRHDYYRFDPAHHRLQGERSGKVYRLSDRLKVKVVRVDLDERKVDFEPV